MITAIGLRGIRCTGYALAILFSATLVSAAHAQIEEITVHATKRAAPLQDVPIAITVIDSESLRQAGVDSLRDLRRAMPGFSVASSQTETNASTFRLRGIGTAGNNIGFESSVGVFLDDVYLSRPGVALTDLVDVEQIEVMRGPQGTVFGRNTSAGALNIRTRKPDLVEEEYWLSLGAGNYNARRLAAGINVPLVVDKVGLRLSGSMRDRDGFVTSTTGADSRTRDRQFLRGQVLWRIGDDVTLRLIGDYSNADEQCCDAPITTDTPLVALGAFAAAGLPADGGAPVSGAIAREDRISNSEGFESDFTQQGVSTEVTWNINDVMSLTYLGAYRDYESDTVQNSDLVNIDVFTAPGSASDTGLFDEIRFQSHELRLTGANDRLDWLIGINVADERIEQGISLQLGSDFAAYVDAAAWYGLIIPATSGTALEAIALPTGGTFGDVLTSASPTVAFAGGLDPVGAFAGNRYRQHSKPWSIFTHNTFLLSDRLDVIVGLRYIDEDKEGSFTQDSASNPACFATLGNAAALLPASDIGFAAAAFACFPFAVPADVPGTPLPSTFAGEFKDDELMYTGKLMYHVSDSVGVYAGLTHGFKSGGFNLDATAAILGADPRFRSETVDSWELGLKGYWLEDKLRANVTMFHMSMDDFQVTEFTGLQFVTFNVPDVKSSGVEVEMKALLSENITLELATIYNDARYSRNCTGGTAISAPEISALCGYDLSNAPEWSGTLGAEYFGELTDRLDFNLYGSLEFSSDYRTGIQAVDPTSLVPLVDDIQDSYTKLNLGLELRPPEGNWSIRFWGLNVFDERTHHTSFNAPLRGISAIGTAARGVFLDAPRTYGADFRINF